ncbi:MAG: RNA-binding domain-containing protein [Thermoplasmatota archaeon]
MDQETFLNLLKRGETQEIEFKTRVPKDIGEEICALANSNGGTILIGISDEGDLTGCNIKNSKEKISQHLNNITPPVEVEYDQTNIDEKEFLVVYVPKSDHLCGIGGTVFLRTGTSKRPLSIQEILAQGTETLLFEIDKTPTDKTPNDQYIEKFASEARIEIKSIHEYLKNMEAITKEGKLTIASLLMFHEEPQSSLPHTSVRMTFQDGSWKRFKGPLWKIVKNLEEEMKNRFTLTSIQPGFKRLDVYEYPMKAIREALINALVHRNYGIKSEVFIDLSSNRLEIKNPGSFPPGTTPESPHPVPRNPILYELIFQMGYVERQGRGIQLIKKECEKHPFVSFKYEFDTNFTILNFKKEVNSFTEQEKEILSSLSEDEKSAKELASELDVSKVTVLKKIDRLRELKLVTKKGTGPSTRYKLEKEFT